MNGFQERLARRLGYPERRKGALAEAARRSGLASHVIGRWLDEDDPVTPSPANLEAIAPYLEIDYDELLLMVYGHKPQLAPVEPTTPLDRLLRAADTLVDATADIRASVLDILKASQPSHDPQMVDDRPQTNQHYGWQVIPQTSVLTGHPGFVQKITQLWPRRHRQQAA